jgi:hypothetical protein
MSVSSVGTPAPTVLTLSTPLAARGTDGDSAAQEALETRSTNQAEKANGGYAPKPKSGLVNKTA